MGMIHIRASNTAAFLSCVIFELVLIGSCHSSNRNDHNYQHQAQLHRSGIAYMPGPTSPQSSKYLSISPKEYHIIQFLPKRSFLTHRNYPLDRWKTSTAQFDSHIYQEANFFTTKNVRIKRKTKKIGNKTQTIKNKDNVVAIPDHLAAATVTRSMPQPAVTESQRAETMTSDEDQEAVDMTYVQTIISIVVPCAFGLIVFIGVVGNSLIIFIVMSNARMQSVTNILILNLAVADLSFILVCVPFTAIVYSLFSWPFGTVACKIYQFMINVCAYASVYTLVLMSLDRYLAVVYPVESISIRTPRNTWRAALVMWVVVLAVNSPILYLYQSIPFVAGGDKYVCAIAVDGQEFTKGARILYALFFVLAYVLPLTLIVFLYLGLLRRLWKTGAVGKEFNVTPTSDNTLAPSAPNGTRANHRSRTVNTVRTKRSADSLRSKRKVTRMVTIVVVIFALSWLPNNIIFLTIHFGYYPESLLFIAIQISAQCLAYMNSCINPILYAFLSDNFRKAFCQILSKIPAITFLRRHMGDKNSGIYSTTRDDFTLSTTKHAVLTDLGKPGVLEPSMKHLKPTVKGRMSKRARFELDDDEIVDASLMEEGSFCVMSPEPDQNPQIVCEQPSSVNDISNAKLTTSFTTDQKPYSCKVPTINVRSKINSIIYDNEDSIFEV